MKLIVYQMFCFCKSFEKSILAFQLHVLHTSGRKFSRACGVRAGMGGRGSDGAGVGISHNPSGHEKKSEQRGRVSWFWKAVGA